MSSATDPRKTVRVLAAHSNKNKEHETVNIVTSRLTRDQLSIPEYRQETTLVNDKALRTVIPSASTQPHLRTIFISGYGGPV